MDEGTIAADPPVSAVEEAAEAPPELANIGADSNDGAAAVLDPVEPSQLEEEATSFQDEAAPVVEPSSEGTEAAPAVAPVADAEETAPESVPTEEVANAEEAVAAENEGVIAPRDYVMPEPAYEGTEAAPAVAPVADAEETAPESVPTEEVANAEEAVAAENEGAIAPRDYVMPEPAYEPPPQIEMTGAENLSSFGGGVGEESFETSFGDESYYEDYGDEEGYYDDYENDEGYFGEGSIDASFVVSPGGTKKKKKKRKENPLGDKFDDFSWVPPDLEKAKKRGKDSIWQSGDNKFKETGVSDFGQMSDGMELYFYTLQNLALLFLVLSLLALPLTLIATSGNRNLALNPETEGAVLFANQSLANIGYNPLTEAAVTWCDDLDGTHDCVGKRWVGGFELSARTVTWVVAFYEGVASVVLIAASTWLVWQVERLAQHIDDDTSSAADFTVFVRNLPLDVTESAIIGHFNYRYDLNYPQPVYPVWGYSQFGACLTVGFIASFLFSVILGSSIAAKIPVGALATPVLILLLTGAIGGTLYLCGYGKEQNQETPLERWEAVEAKRAQYLTDKRAELAQWRAEHAADAAEAAAEEAENQTPRTSRVAPEVDGDGGEDADPDANDEEGDDDDEAVQMTGGAPEGLVSDDKEGAPDEEDDEEDEEEDEEDWMAEAERTNFGLKPAPDRPEYKPVPNARHNGLPSVLGSCVADLHIVYPNGEVISRYLQQKRLLAEIEVTRAQVQKYKEKTPFPKGADPKKEKKFRKKLDKLDGKIEGVHAKVIAQIKDTRTAAHCAGCFVTFNHEESQMRCISDYRCSGGWLGRFFQPEHFRFMWHRDDEKTDKKVPIFKSLRLEQAPEPSDVYWENLNLSDTSRFLRLAFSNLITFCLLLFSFVIAILAAGAQQEANAEIASTNFCDDLPAVWYGTYTNNSRGGAPYAKPVIWVRPPTANETEVCGANRYFIVNQEMLGCPNPGGEFESPPGSAEDCVPNALDPFNLPDLKIPFLEKYDTVASGNDPFVLPGYIPRGSTNTEYYGGDCPEGNGNDPAMCPGASSSDKCPAELDDNGCPGGDCECVVKGTPTKAAPFYPTYDFDRLCDDVCVSATSDVSYPNKTGCASLACHFKEDRINKFSGWNTDNQCFYHPPEEAGGTALYPHNAVANCYCRQQWTKLGPFSIPLPDDEFCTAFFETMDKSTSMSLVAILVVLVVNAIALPLIKTLVLSERRMSVSTEKAALIVKMFAVQFMNTALITLVVNMAYNTEKNNPDMEFFVKTLRVGGGEYSDFGRSWYASIGAALCNTMLIQAISPHGSTIAAAYVIKPLLASKTWASKVTQEEVDELYRGPEFEIEKRASFIGVALVVSLMYSTGLPMLTFFAAFNFALAYAVDKWLLLKKYEQPPMYDASIPRFLVNLLMPATFLHMCIGIYMLSNDNLMPGPAIVAGADQAADTALEDGEPRTSFHEFVIPRLLEGHTFCLCFLFGLYCALFFFWIFGLLDEMIEYGTLTSTKYCAKLLRVLHLDKGHDSYEAEAALFNHEDEPRPAYCDVYKSTLNRSQLEAVGATGKLSAADKRRGFELSSGPTGEHVVKYWMSDSEVHGVPRKKGDLKCTWEHMRDGGLGTFCYDIGLNRKYKSALKGIDENAENGLPMPSRSMRIEKTDNDDDDDDDDAVEKPSPYAEKLWTAEDSEAEAAAEAAATATATAEAEATAEAAAAEFAEHYGGSAEEQEAGEWTAEGVVDKETAAANAAASEPPAIIEEELPAADPTANSSNNKEKGADNDQAAQAATGQGAATPAALVAVDESEAIPDAPSAATVDDGGASAEDQPLAATAAEAESKEEAAAKEEALKEEAAAAEAEEKAAAEAATAAAAAGEAQAAAEREAAEAAAAAAEAEEKAKAEAEAKVKAEAEAAAAAAAAAEQEEFARLKAESKAKAEAAAKEAAEEAARLQAEAEAAELAEAVIDDDAEEL